jgi:thiol:disulfide interchange protein DsbD
MKRFVTLLIIIFCSFHSFSQILEPIKWSTSVEKISDTEAILIATATIDSKWHLYSQTVPEDGPIATSFLFEDASNYLKKGNTAEETGHIVDDAMFNMRIKFFDTKTSFKQKIILKTKNAFKVNATVEFMACDDTRCLSPTEVDLLFEVK